MSILQKLLKSSGILHRVVRNTKNIQWDMILQVETACWWGGSEKNIQAGYGKAHNYSSQPWGSVKHLRIDFMLNMLADQQQQSKSISWIYSVSQEHVSKDSFGTDSNFDWKNVARSFSNPALMSLFWLLVMPYSFQFFKFFYNGFNNTLFKVWNILF